MSNLNNATGFEKWTILVDVALFNHLGHGNDKHRLLHHKAWANFLQIWSFFDRKCASFHSNLKGNEQ